MSINPDKSITENSYHISPEKHTRIESALQQNGIILFDGVCNLCNSSVNFILDRDTYGYFKFASLQSEVGSYLIDRFGLSGDVPDSVILIKNYRVYLQSTAALEIARGLRGPVKLLYGGIIIPKFLRNPIYNFIARNRYKWFGKLDECRIPTPELQSLFIE